MNKYINADNLIEILNAKANMALGTPKEVFFSVANMISKLPPANATVIKHGKWLDMGEEDLSYENVYACSVCNNWFYLSEGTPENNDYNYCPNCGARMDVTENET